MKKFVAVLFAFIFFISLTSCGAKSNTAYPETEYAELPETEATEETATVSEPATATQAEAEAETVTETATERKITAADAKAAYKKTLERIIEGNEKIIEEQGTSFETTCFSLIYLDDNDVPELVISTGYNQAGTAVLYSFDGQKVINQGPFGRYGMFKYMPRKGIIATWYSGYTVMDAVSYYKFDNNTVYELTSVGEEVELADDEMITKYYIGETAVPKEAYESEISKYGSIDDFSNAPEGTLIPEYGSKLPNGVYALTKENINKF